MLRNATDDKTMSEARFSKNCLIYGPKFPQNDTNLGKTQNFQVLLHFRPFFEQILKYFLASNGFETQQ